MNYSLLMQYYVTKKGPASFQDMLQNETNRSQNNTSHECYVPYVFTQVKKIWIEI